MSDNKTKIVFLGAGSISFGMSMLRDLVTTHGLSGSTLMLVTQHAETAARTAELAHYLNNKMGAGLIIESTTDRRSALDGAGFVVNSTAIERNRLWKFDFEVPKKYGIRHTLGENGGPGALFFTLRTLPMIFDFIRDMEELCPNALFLNFSNPESRIVMALGRYSKIRCIGLCHGISIGRNQVAEIMKLPADEVDVWGAGLNHFQCLMRIRHRKTGEDLYPRLRAAELNFDPAASPLTRRLFRAFGYWLTCGDGHLGEHLSYGWEGGEEGYNFAGDEWWRAEFAKIAAGVLAGSAPMPDYWVEPSGEQGAAVIAAVLQNQKRYIEFRNRLQPGRHSKPSARVGRRSAGYGRCRRGTPCLAGAAPGSDREADVYGGQCSTTRGRGGGPCVKGAGVAGFVDRPRRQFCLCRGTIA